MQYFGEESGRFCPGLKNVSIAKVKSVELALMEEEISKQHRIHSSVWLLVVKVIKVNNKKYQAY